MSLIDSLLGALGEKGGPSGGQPANPLADAIGGILAQNGGVEGLMQKFSHGGLGDIFASWVGTGANQPITAAQLQDVLGSKQLAGIAEKLGIKPSQASAFLSQHLPKIVDQLTPQGRVDPSTPSGSGLVSLISSLLHQFQDNPGQQAPPQS